MSQRSAGFLLLPSVKLGIIPDPFRISKFPSLKTWGSVVLSGIHPRVFEGIGNRPYRETRPGERFERGELIIDPSRTDALRMTCGERR